MKHQTFFGARLQDRLTKPTTAVLRRAGWQERIVPYIGYGTPEHVRILGQVELASPDNEESGTLLGMSTRKLLAQRGWHNFMSVPAPKVRVSVTIGDTNVHMRSDRRGYIDLRVKDHGLAPGWHTVTLSTDEAPPVEAPVQVISSDETFGLVSDIDDTILTTFLPRALLAAWNSFVLTEEARRSVPGMARMYQHLLADHPGAPIVYVSTGSWSTVPFLTRFMGRHGYPKGPMLLTSWGPTNTGWFRSGTEHKRRALRELARDFPNITWVLVGDDGQYDPMLYREFAELQPGHARAIAIRQLPMAEQVLAHGTTTVMEDNQHLGWVPDLPPEVKAPDGFELEPQLMAALAGDVAQAER